jgi:hypothetical protein
MNFDYSLAALRARTVTASEHDNPERGYRPSWMSSPTIKSNAIENSGE